MTQVNMLQAKTELSKLVRKLESGEENIIYIARNGNPVAQITLINKAPAKKRIGIARGKLSVDDEAFDSLDDEIAGMFQEQKGASDETSA